LLTTIYATQIVNRIVVLDNSSFATTGYRELVTIWDFKRTKSQIKHLGFSCCLKKPRLLIKIKDDILAMSDSSYIGIWNYTSGKKLHYLLDRGGGIIDIFSLKNGSVVSYAMNKITIWDTKSGKICNKLVSRASYSISCAGLVLPDVLACASTEKIIRLWNLTTGLRMRTLLSEGDIIECMEEMERGLFASGDRGGIIKLWSLNTSSDGLVTYMDGHEGFIQALIKLKPGHLASASRDKTVKIWNYERYLEYGVALLATLRGHRYTVSCLCLLPDGLLASGSEDKTIKIWNLTAIYSYPNRSVLIPVDF
jgi:WD40 repeat protein